MVKRLCQVVTFNLWCAESAGIARAKERKRNASPHHFARSCMNSPCQAPFLPISNPHICTKLHDITWDSLNTCIPHTPHASRYAYPQTTKASPPLPHDEREAARLQGVVFSLRATSGAGGPFLGFLGQRRGFYACSPCRAFDQPAKHLRARWQASRLNPAKIVQHAQMALIKAKGRDCHRIGHSRHNVASRATLSRVRENTYAETSQLTCAT